MTAEFNTNLSPKSYRAILTIPIVWVKDTESNLPPEPYQNRKNRRKKAAENRRRKG